MKFAFLSLLDRHLAEDKVVDTYRQFANSLPLQGDGETDLVTVLRSLWNEIKATKHPDSSGDGQLISHEENDFHQSLSLNFDENHVFYALSALPVISRAILVGVDGLGFDEEQMAFILSLQTDEVCKQLGKARKAMLSVG